jgi:hypothetical protein
VCDGDGQLSLWQAGHVAQPYFVQQLHNKNCADFVFQVAFRSSVIKCLPWWHSQLRRQPVKFLRIENDVPVGKLYEEKNMEKKIIFITSLTSLKKG